MKPQVLILEDNFLVAENLAEIVQEDLKAQPLAVCTVSEAVKIIPDGIDFAFLDIELPDGNSFPVAKILMQNKIPFIFVSGNENQALPREFQDVPFVSKPAPTSRLLQLCKSMSSAFG